MSVRYYAYRGRDIYDVSASDEASLGLLSDSGFLFFSTEDYQRATTMELMVILHQLTGKSGVHTSRDVVINLLEATAKKAKAYFKPSVEVPSKGTIYSLEKDPAEAKDIPKQMRGILVCLNNAGGQLEESQLIEAMKDYITTRQPLSEIFRFYRKRLLNEGWVTMEVKR